MSKKSILVLITIFQFAFLNAQTEIKLVRDFYKGSDNHTESYMRSNFFPIVFKNKIYYIGKDSATGHELCVTSGDSASTKMVVDFNPGYDETFDYYGTGEGVIFGNKMVFTGNASSYNIELLCSDGTDTGTKVYKEFVNGYGSGYPKGLAVFNNHLFLGAEILDSNYYVQHFLYMFDSTGNLIDSFKNFKVSNPIFFKNHLYYTAAYDSGYFNYGLIKIDSNFNITKITSADPIDYAFFNQKGLDSVIILSGSSSVYGDELYYYKDDSIKLLKDINSGSSPSYAQNFTRFKNKIYFSANDGSNGAELWVTNGTDSGTILLKNIADGSFGSSPQNFIEFKDELFFIAYDTSLGFELWKTDGTTNGTVLVKDIYQETYSYEKTYVDIKNLTVINNKLYFSALIDTFGFELFASDGTTNGTKLIANINTNDNSWNAGSDPFNFIEFNDTLYFQAYTVDEGIEWRKLIVDNSYIFFSLGNDTSACGGITLIADTAFTSYLWNTNDTTNSLSITSTGTYWLQVTDAFNNIFIDSIQITINPNPTLTLPTTLDSCSNGFVFDGGAGFTSYAWSFDNGSRTDTGRYVTLTPADSTLFLTVTNSFGCQSASSTALSIHALPMVNLGNDTTNCGSYTLNAPSGYTNLWSDNSTSSSLSVTSSGRYWLQITDGNSCSNRDSINVTINPNPTLNLPTTLDSCSNGFVFDGGAGFTSYAWSFDNGSRTDTGRYVTLTPADSTLFLTVTNSFGCQSSGSTALSIHALPMVNLGNDTTNCGSYILNAPSGYTNLWSDNSTSSSLSVTSSGTYWLQVTDGNSCTNRDSIIVTINPNPSLSLPNDTTLCDINGYSLIAPIGYKYLWSNGDTTLSIKVSGPDTYVLTIINANNCQSTDSIRIFQGEIPKLTIQDTFENCDSVLISTTNYYQYEWNNVKGDSTYQSFESEKINLKVFSKDGCFVTKELQTIVNYAPKLSNLEFQVNNLEVSFKYPLLDNNSSIVWYFGTGDSSKQKEPIYKYEKNGIYKVKVIVSNSCGSISLDSSLTIKNVGIYQTSSKSEIIIYPNPSKDFLSIKGLTQNATFKLYDIHGKIVNESDELEQMNISFLASGIYTAVIVSDQNTIIHLEKIIINK